MAYPQIIDFVTIKDWVPEIKETQKCYLYDFESMGITPEQFASVFIGRKAVLFEKPFSERVTGSLCPWCDFKANKSGKAGSRLIDHIFSHQNKNILSYQLVKFQKEMHTLKLQFIRKGYHEAVGFFVEHSCQDCLDSNTPGREGMCALPVSSRPRMRSLRVLGYPVNHLLNHPKRRYKWSALGIIVLMKTEISEQDIL